MARMLLVRCEVARLAIAMAGSKTSCKCNFWGVRVVAGGTAWWQDRLLVRICCGEAIIDLDVELLNLTGGVRSEKF
ncbi:conserved hypothetical protein [Ricinus communis]|uniref:Uncharacterized protein n=1 Tax=Ricinus communis TaxID=3988 RepID=B9SAX9_RICCO|nr:conserved hypothetical protein [Ricinus communis]